MKRKEAPAYARCRGVRGLLLLGALLGCTPDAEQTHAPSRWRQEQVDRLVNLIGRRMELMESVARWKWQQGRAIEDPDREAALLQSLSAKAKERDLDPDFVQAFFETQIAAAKGVQQFWFEKWNRYEPPADEPVPDLLTEIRPQLSALSEELLQVLADSVAGARDPAWQTAVEQKVEARLDAGYWTESLRREVLAPLWDLGTTQ